MAQKPHQFFSSHNDHVNMVESREGNPLAITCLVLSIVAVCISMTGDWAIESLELRKVKRTHYESGDASVITDKTGNAFTFLEQVVVFVVSKVASVSLSLTAATIGIVALGRRRSTPAIVGIALSAFSILATFR